MFVISPDFMMYGLSNVCYAQSYLFFGVRNHLASLTQQMVINYSHHMASENAARVG